MIQDSKRNDKYHYVGHVVDASWKLACHRGHLHKCSPDPCRALRACIEVYLARWSVCSHPGMMCTAASGQRSRMPTMTYASANASRPPRAFWGYVLWRPGARSLFAMRRPTSLQKLTFYWRTAKGDFAGKVYARLILANQDHPFVGTWKDLGVRTKLLHVLEWLVRAWKIHIANACGQIPLFVTSFQNLRPSMTPQSSQWSSRVRLLPVAACNQDCNASDGGRACSGPNIRESCAQRRSKLR